MDEEKKYRKSVDLLKKAGQLNDAHLIEREVMSRLYKMENRKSQVTLVYDFLFGWTEITWVRRSLAIASFILIVMFVYQQSVIVRQLNILSSQVKFDDSYPASVYQSEVISRYRLIKASGNRMDERSSPSEEQIQMIIRSYDKLRSDYDNLMKAIENDPELKRILNEHIVKVNSEKVKI
jgi:hypothetical protein